MRWRERLRNWRFWFIRRGVLNVLPMTDAEHERFRSEWLGPSILNTMHATPNIRMDCDEVPPTKEQSMGKFEIFRDKSGEYRWRLKARNGKTVAQSEGYVTRAGAIRSCKAVQTAANGARVVE